VTEFGELQHALVDAARHRYGRAARSRRIARPVLVAAACAAIVATVVVLAGTRAPDERVPTPAVTPTPTELERAFAVFSRPPTEADTLPDVESFSKYMIGRADRADFDPRQARLVVHDGDLRVFLAPVPMDGRPAVCAFVAVNGKFAAAGGCGVLDYGPVAPTFDGDPDDVMVRDYSSPPLDGRAGRILAVVRNGIDELTFNFADGSTLRLPVRDNVVFHTPLKAWPESIEWVDADGKRHTKATLSLPAVPGGP
jgi:hypothetical protein